jgi:hypothetical protein
MMALYLLQTFVPPLLIAWLAFAPPRSTVGFWVQVFATGVGLVAVSATGIWMFPPWWAPYAFAALLFGVIICDVVRRRDQPLWPHNITGWLSLAFFGALGLYAANDARVAFAAREIPPGESFDLASPLGAGTYLVANGGGAPSVNAHAIFGADRIGARATPSI